MMKTIITLAAFLMITSCGGITNNRAMNTLPDIVQMGQNLLSRDTIQQNEYPVINDKQHSDLARVTKVDVPDNTMFIGVRSAGNGFTVEAYNVPTGEDPNQFKVYLLTRDKSGVIVDNLDLHEFHTSEHQGPMRLGGNRFYTTDAELRFDDANHFTLHRVMTLTSIYLKNHQLTEAWRVEWDNRYEINGKGHFQFVGQQETFRTEGLDNPIIEEFKSRDLPKR